MGTKQQVGYERARGREGERARAMRLLSKFPKSWIVRRIVMELSFPTESSSNDRWALLLVGEFVSKLQYGIGWPIRKRVIYIFRPNESPFPSLRESLFFWAHGASRGNEVDGHGHDAPPQSREQKGGVEPMSVSRRYPT
eukprot:scaffold8828_cov204-Amphora_coffeaeformis.AAC.16